MNEREDRREMLWGNGGKEEERGKKGGKEESNEFECLFLPKTSHYFNSITEYE